MSLCFIKGIAPTTIRNYTYLSAVDKSKKILSKIQHKTDSQHITENSILSTISYLFTIAASHLIIGTCDPQYNIPSLSTATKGARDLVSLVSRANKNAPIYPVLPGLITSTDDTTVFVFKGTAKESKGW